MLAVDLRETARKRLTELADWLNDRYMLPLAEVTTSGPRQGLADETPYMQVAREHTPADVLVAVSIETLDDDLARYRIEVYTSTAWGAMGDPFMVLKHLTVRPAADAIRHYVPYTPTT